jgi:hypothetical protein
VCVLTFLPLREVTVAEVFHWLDAHPHLTGLVLFFVLSALVNWLARVDTPEEWERLKAEQPRVAAVLALLRGVGVEPYKLARALQAIVRGRWPVSPLIAPPEESKRKDQK